MSRPAIEIGDSAEQLVTALALALADEPVEAMRFIVYCPSSGFGQRATDNIDRIISKVKTVQEIVVATCFGVKQS